MTAPELVAGAVIPEPVDGPPEPPPAPSGVRRTPRRRAGAMEKAVKADLAAMKLPVAAAYLGQSAVLIARAIDGYAETAESAAQLSAIVKANVELRQTMAAIQKAAAGSSTAESAEDDVEGLATPS